LQELGAVANHPAGTFQTLLLDTLHVYSLSEIARK
jgi:hypothetical protein